MSEKILFEEFDSYWGTDPEPFALPYIMGYRDSLETYIADNSSNTIIVPLNANRIGAYAFDAEYHLENFREDDILGKDFEYPENIGTDYIEKIVLHKKVEAIDPTAFSGLKSLKMIEVEEGNRYFKGGDVLYATRVNRELLEFIWCSPFKTGGYTVAPWIEDICDHAFENSKLDSVTFGENVCYFGEEVFKNCPNIVIKAPEGSYAIEYAKENGLKFEEIIY